MTQEEETATESLMLELRDNIMEADRSEAALETILEHMSKQISLYHLEAEKTATLITQELADRNWINESDIPDYKNKIVELADKYSIAQKMSKQLPEGFWYDKDLSIEYNHPLQGVITLCTPIRFLAQIRDFENKRWGTELEVQDPDKLWHRTVVYFKELSSSNWTGRLQNRGMKILGDAADLAELINKTTSEERLRVTDKTGWHDQTFVMRKESISKGEAEPIRFDNEISPQLYHQNGTLHGWQQSVAKKAIGNHKLAFVLSMGFAAPLLHDLQMKGGGFHIYGSSSHGKTTLLECAYSVVGGSQHESFTPGWRTTDNGLERTARMHNHTLLTLDELSQIKAEDLSPSIYMLGNGEGKERRNQKSSSIDKWSLLFLSTGELTIKEKIQEAKKQTFYAGMAVRAIDISVDAGANNGAFEELHGAKDARTFVDELKKAVRDHHGTAMREFLKLFVQNRQDYIGRIQKLMEDFIDQAVPQGADGQIFRVCRRFALVAAAGTLATELGILPWPEDFARQAARRNFDQWLEKRGTLKSLEAHDGVEAIIVYLRRFGKKRFEKIKGEGLTISNKIGYRRHKTTPSGKKTTEYIIPVENFREVCNGHDKRSTLNELKNQNMLSHNKGRLDKNVRIPKLGKVVRCHVIVVTPD